MAYNQDSRPFVDLKKDAKEFQAKFDDDIKECLSSLDEKITALICDPDSLGNQVKSIRHNALAEFSKAKYDIFISVKSLINKKEKEWLEYIAEMKKLFVENVEIFLAGTKLEVKLPSSQFQSSVGPRKSPGNRKSNSTSVASSFIDTITKNIPVLSSSLHRQEASSKVSKDASNVGDNLQFSRRGRLSTSSVKLSESQSANFKLFQKESSSSSDTPEEEIENKMEVDETEFDLNASQSSSRGRSNSEKEAVLGISVNSNQHTKVCGRRGKLEVNSSTQNGLPQENSDNDSEETAVPDQINTYQSASKVRGRRGKQSVINTKIENVTNPKKSTRRQAPRSKETVEKSNNNSEIQKSSCSSEENEAVMEAEKSSNKMPLQKRRGRPAAKNKEKASTVLPPPNQITEDTDDIHEEEEPTEGVANAKFVSSRSATSKNTKNISGVRAAGRGRRAAKNLIEEEINKPGTSKSPKKVTFTADEDFSDDLDIDIDAPVVRPSKSAARRKTMLPNLEDITGADIIPGNPSYSRNKRKTISGVSDLASVAPPKRLRVGSRKSVSPQEEDDANDNPLETDENYSEWMPLKSVDGKIPTCPAIYEVKVWRAKKPAYIGSCESLRQKLTLYKMRQNSSHKHLDKFIERNYDDIQVRYEVVPSFDDAKEDVKNRVKSFAAQHKTTPAYN